MIIQPTLEQTRRINRKRAYSGHGFGPRSFECFGIGIGLGLGSCTVPGAIAQAPLSSYFTPANLLQGCQSHLSLSYASVMLATGGGPAAGISGTLLAGAIPKPVKVVITGNGTQTTATYSLYLDGGTTVVQSGTCAASVAIGALPGLSVTFPVGSYTTAHSWQAVASAWGDPAGTDGQGYTFSGSAQPLISPGVNGYPGLLFDGVNDVGINTTLNCPATTAIRLIYRMLTWTASTSGGIVGPNSNAASPVYYHASAIQSACYAGSNGATASAIVGSSLNRVRALYSGSVGDNQRYGANVGTAAGAGAARTGTGRQLAGSAFGGFTGTANCEIFGVYYLSADPTSQDAAFDTAATGFYTGLNI